MGIPEEDRGPRELRDYVSPNFGAIEADIAAMEEFAKKLTDGVDKSYAPHMKRVTESMSGSLPEPVGFPELATLLTTHREAQELTHNNLYNFASGTSGFAVAAHDISEKYRGSDAFARAKVSDVEATLGKVTTQTAEGS